MLPGSAIEPRGTQTSKKDHIRTSNTCVNAPEMELLCNRLNSTSPLLRSGCQSIEGTISADFVISCKSNESAQLLYDRVTTSPATVSSLIVAGKKWSLRYAHGEEQDIDWTTHRLQFARVKEEANRSTLLIIPEPKEPTSRKAILYLSNFERTNVSRDARDLTATYSCKGNEWSIK